MSRASVWSMLMVLVTASGCVRRVATLPAEYAAQPLPPEGKVELVVLPDEPRPTWRLSGRTETCEAPCAMQVGVGERLVVSASSGVALELNALPQEVTRARRAVLVPEPTNRALQVNGIVFTTLGAMTTVVAIVLTAVGCGDLARRAGMCTAGLVTGGVGVPLMGASILMLVASAPQVHLLPVSASRSAPPAVAVTPLGVVGRF